MKGLYLALGIPWGMARRGGTAALILGPAKARDGSTQGHCKGLARWRGRKFSLDAEMLVPWQPGEGPLPALRSGRGADRRFRPALNRAHANYCAGEKIKTNQRPTRLCTDPKSWRKNCVLGDRVRASLKGQKYNLNWCLLGCLRWLDCGHHETRTLAGTLEGFV